MTKLREQVLEFHRAYGQPIGGRPHHIAVPRLQLRLSLIAEEFFELLESCVSHRYAPLLSFVKDVVAALIRQGGQLNGRDVDLVGIADALADLDYVIEGTRIELGIDGEPIADEVHRSNMSKLGADGKPVLNEYGKVTKGPSYSPPDIVSELRKQGWEGS